MGAKSQAKKIAGGQERKKGLSRISAFESKVNERLAHLNAVLRAIRNIDQLIVKEKDRRRLIQGVCDNLVRTRGFHGAWIALLADGDLPLLASSGFSDRFPELATRFARGLWPDCAHRVLRSPGVYVKLSPAEECGDCPLAKDYPDRSAMAVRLAHGGRNLGVLGVSVPAAFADDREERGLLKETAEDLGFALQNINLEAEHKLAEERLLSKAAIENSVKRMFREALVSESEEQLGKTCLALAEEVTESKFGFIDELNAVGRADTIAISDPGWEVCRMPRTDAVIMLKNLEVRGIWASVIRQGRSQIINDPASHQDRVGTPPGHPPLTSLLGVPLKQAGRTIGLIGLANKEAGYSQADQEAVEALSTAFVEALVRKRAEGLLQKSLEDLKRSNQELEQFAYVASHDLQEPLRMVSSYTQLLAKRYQDKLDQDARDFIQYAVNGSQRMQQLIQDLLAYSRVSTRGQPLVQLNAQAVLGEAVANLQASIRETGALVTNDELPMVFGDRIQIAQVFQNLIGNAIKFHKPGEPPRVHVSAERRGEGLGFWTFRVADNGIGIDPKHFDRIFVIFQRLHARNEYAGTGIGLAICKRIVTRHGGQIWLESEPGRGTSVFFTLPAIQPEKGDGR